MNETTAKPDRFSLLQRGRLDSSGEREKRKTENIAFGFDVVERS